MARKIGPHNLQAHEAIHNSVMADLDAAMRLLHRALVSGTPNEAYELAGAILDIWTERALWHARFEESELYRQLPSLQPLIRDHDLMAEWVSEARYDLDKEGAVDPCVMAKLEALLILLHTHNAHELQSLRTLPAGLTPLTSVVPSS